MDELTPQEIAEQDRKVRDALDAVLQPLINAGIVWHPRSGPIMDGPGCMVRANADGVARLVADTRVLHIVDVSE